MKRNPLIIIFIVIDIIAILGIILFYVYDITFLNSAITDNLFRTISIVIILIVVLIRLCLSSSRKSLDIYERAYNSELGSAFNDKPFSRKKLLCASRLYDEKNYNKALKYLFQLLKESKSERDIIPVLLFIALCYTDAGVTDDAIRVYYDLLRYDPRNPQVHSNLGALYIKTGDFDLALQHYNKSIECNPYNYFAYVNRANYYFRVREYDSAIFDAKKALELNNNGHEAASLLAIIYAMRKNKEMKEKYYHIAITAGRNPYDLNEAIKYYMNVVEQDDSSFDE